MFKINNKLKLIIVDQDYMKALYDVCDQVYFLPSYYATKPYIGILINDNKREYVIPLTSAKTKHKVWPNYYDGKMLIYETLKYRKNKYNGICISNNDGTIKHIMAVLMINKMIPIKKGVYSVIDINLRPDDDKTNTNYKLLLNKEFSFCVSRKEIILKEANKTYNRQIETHKVFYGYCDFQKLEIVCDNYYKI